jgi:hypothetical protein
MKTWFLGFETVILRYRTANFSVIKPKIKKDAKSFSRPFYEP